MNNAHFETLMSIIATFEIVVSHSTLLFTGGHGSIM